MAPPSADAAAGDGARRSRPPPDGRAASRSSQASIGELLGALLHDVPRLLSDRVHLLALELRRARRALIGMIGLAVLAAILALTAWASFWALLVVVAVRQGMPLESACLVVLLVNLIGVWLALRRVRTLAGYLALPATTRQLTSASSTAADQASAAPAGDSHDATSTAGTT